MSGLEVVPRWPTFDREGCKAWPLRLDSF